MKSWIRDDEVRRHVPKGRVLPERFDDFVRAELPFRIEWNDLDQCNLKPSARNEALPFLRLPDGGLVALWYHAEVPAVVYLGSEGQLEAIASDFDDFVKGIGAKCCGLPDFDDSEEDFSVPGVHGTPEATDLSAMQEKFEKWFKQHTLLLEPLFSAEAEALRQRVFGIVESMLRDGRSKVYSPSSSWWSMDFRIDRDGDDLSITYLDFGRWHPVPSQYHLAEAITELLNLVKDNERSRYELSVHSPGLVSVDQDRQLLLIPPESRPNK